MISRLFEAAAKRPRGAVAMAVCVVLVVAYWEPLFAGATLAPTDLTRHFAHPFAADRPFGFVPDKASGDLVNIHAHWTMVGRSFREMSGWWDRSVALGYPVMKGGFPAFAAPYLVLPAWFAPGAATVLRTATAWGLTHGWMRTFGLRRAAAFVAGAAYAFSGFMVGWGGWPHASVAAFAPGLLWAVERMLADPSPRRGIPIGVLLALMVWSNFPLVTVYVLAGVAIYGLVRVVVEHGRGAANVIVRLLPPGLVAAVVGAGLSYPHLRFFPEWLDWADTSHRQFNADSSAGVEFLLTALLPGAFGGDGHGPAWWEYGNWVEFEIHVGLPVLALAGFAIAAARGTDRQARRRRGAVWGLWAMVVVGVLVGYVGGPPTEATQALLGDLSGLATRIKVLISLGFAGLAGFGFEAWIDDRQSTVAARRRLVWWVCGVAAAVGVLLLPSTWSWYHDMVRLGHRRTTAVAALPFVALGGLALALLVARSRRWLSASAFTVAFGVVLVAELLTFARPIPTVVDRDERLRETAAHEVAAAALDPGERLAGHRTTFYPASTQVFGIEALGGQTFKSPGYRALIELVADDAFRVEGGGTPTYPALQPHVEADLALWDALGVGVWAMEPFNPPPGPRLEPDAPFAFVDAAAGDLTGSVVIPDGGLRAVLLEAVVMPAAGRLTIVVEAEGERVETTVRRDDGVLGNRYVLPVPVVGEHLEVGAVARVRAHVTGDGGSLELGVDADGELVVGSIAGSDDGLRLIHAGSVTVFERERAAPFRLHDAAVVEPDLDRAAAAVVARAEVQGQPVVVDEAIGLPAKPDPSARLDIVSVDVEQSRLEVVVDTDRDALLVVPVADYPGWTATVDGTDLRLVTADGVLTGVVVPAGEHTVVLRFSPDGVGRSIAIAALTAVAALGWFAGSRRERRAGQSPG